MSLRARLSGAFALCVLAAAGLGAFSLWSAHRLNAYTIEIAMRWLPAVESAKGMENSLLSANIQVQRHILANDEDGRLKVESQLAATQAEFKRDRDRYAALPELPGTEGSLARVDALMAKYGAGLQTILIVSRHGNTSAATDYVRSLLTPPSQEIAALLGQLVESNTAASQRAAERASADYHRLVVLTAALIVALTAAALIVAVAIVRGVSRQIGGDPSEVFDVVKRIASGDLAVEIRTQRGDSSSLLHRMRGMAEALAAMEASNSQLLGRLQSVMDAAPVGIAFVREGRFELVSAEFCRLFGRDSQALLGQTLGLVSGSREEARELADEITGALRASRHFVAERRLMHCNGSRFWARLSASPVDAGEADAGLTLTVADIGHDIAAREALTWSATHDALTGLLNRRAFDDQLARAFGVEPRTRTAALLLVDLDRFKQINDRYGHAAGDAVLQAVAQAMRASARSGDPAVRLGGDEFALVLEHCPPDAALLVAEGLRQAIAGLALPWHGQLLTLGASIGVAMREASMTTSADWFGAADHACYEAKKAGRNAVRVAAASHGASADGVAAAVASAVAPEAATDTAARV